jgi:hypothetical protein
MLGVIGKDTVRYLRIIFLIEMDKRIQQLSDFFNLYADKFNSALNNGTAAVETTKSFSDCFIGASPLGVRCGVNNEDFRAALQQGYEFYNSIGIKAMDIVSKETTILDDFHEMTKIRWKSSYIKKDSSKGSIEFDNIYFTQTKGKESKIFAYITGDEQAALKGNGLI